MKENVVIFYFRTGGDAFSQKIKCSLCIFSDSFVLYSCSCHVLLAEIRTSEKLTGFHVIALMQTYSHRYSIFVQAVTDSHKELSIFSDSFVVYSSSCHVLHAEAPRRI